MKMEYTYCAVLELATYQAFNDVIAMKKCDYKTALSKVKHNLRERGVVQKGDKLVKLDYPMRKVGNLTQVAIGVEDCSCFHLYFFNLAKDGQNEE